MKCKNCQKEISDNSKYCGYCGAEQTIEKETIEKKPVERENAGRKKKKSKVFVWPLCVILLLAVAGVIFYVFNQKQKTDDSSIAEAVDEYNSEEVKGILKNIAFPVKTENGVQVANINANYLSNTVYLDIEPLYDSNGFNESEFLLTSQMWEEQKIYGVIDSKGKEIIPCNYADLDYVTSKDGENRFFIAYEYYENSEATILDVEGRIVEGNVGSSAYYLGKNYFLTYDFNEGRYAIRDVVKRADIYSTSNSLFCKWNDNGLFLMILYLEDGSSKVNYMNESACVVSDDFKNGSDFNSEGEAFVLKDDGQWAVMNKRGKIIENMQYTEADFDSIGFFDGNNLANIRFEGYSVGYINTNKYGNGSYLYAETDLNGTTSNVKLIPVCNADGMWGYASGVDGSLQIDFKYTYGYEFKNGMAAVKIGDKWGCIDENENWILPPDYDDIRGFSRNNDWCITGIGDRYGIVDQNGNIIIDHIYDTINFVTWVSKELQNFVVCGYIDGQLTYLNPYTGEVLMRPQMASFNPVEEYTDSEYTPSEYTDSYAEIIYDENYAEIVHNVFWADFMTYNEDNIYEEVEGEWVYTNDGEYKFAVNGIFVSDAVIKSSDTEYYYVDSDGKRRKSYMGLIGYMETNGLIVNAAPGETSARNLRDYDNENRGELYAAIVNSICLEYLNSKGEVPETLRDYMPTRKLEDYDQNTGIHTFNYEFHIPGISVYLQGTDRNCSVQIRMSDDTESRQILYQLMESFVSEEKLDNLFALIEQNGANEIHSYQLEGFNGKMIEASQQKSFGIYFYTDTE